MGEFFFFLKKVFISVGVVIKQYYPYARASSYITAAAVVVSDINQYYNNMRQVTVGRNSYYTVVLFI